MIFFNEARVTKNNGCFFYDQDIITLDYSYTGDTKIKLKLNYVNPGFGIILSNDTSAYLFKLGDDDYSVINKRTDYLGVNEQEQVEFSTFPFKHMINDEDVFLILEYVAHRAKFYLQRGAETVALFTEALSLPLETYKIGFYSQYGNTIKSIEISSGLPLGWTPNVISTVGGRLYYYDDTIQFQNCTYEAETETDFIELKAGTYYLNCNIEGDIIPYVFKSSDTLIHEDEKSLLKDNTIILEEDSKISIKFRGKNGSVSNISLSEYKNTQYISSSKNGIEQDPSQLIVDLDKVSKVEILVNIQDIPQAKDAIYYLFKYGDRTYDFKDFPLKEDVSITIDVDKHEAVFNGKTIFFNGPRQKTLYAFYNVNAIIKDLIVYDKSGRSINLLVMNERTEYVDNRLTTPIIVADTDGEPIDLSSSYREVIIPTNQIDMFNKYCVMNLTHKINRYEPEDIQVIGIKEGVEVNPNATNFKDFILSDIGFTYLPFNYRNNIDVKHNMLVYDKETREQYKYIAILYPTADHYMYRFTNWSREWFTGNLQSINLAHPILNTFNNIVVYGTNEEIDTEYFYRVRDEHEIIDVKMAVDTFDTIDNSLIEIDYNRNQLKINANYKYYIVEYLKADSYCINDLKYNELLGKEASQLYEVKIASNKETVNIIYDQDPETKSSKSYKITDIDAKPNQYIVLR